MRVCGFLFLLPEAPLAISLNSFVCFINSWLHFLLPGSFPSFLVRSCSQLVLHVHRELSQALQLDFEFQACLLLFFQLWLETGQQRLPCHLGCLRHSLSCGSFVLLLFGWLNGLDLLIWVLVSIFILFLICNGFWLGLLGQDDLIWLKDIVYALNLFFGKALDDLVNALPIEMDRRLQWLLDRWDTRWSKSRLFRRLL